MNDSLDSVVSKWASLGAGFDATSHETGEIDLERLLLDTARRTPQMARLFIVAATWLHTFGDTIAKHRLKRLVESELESEYQSVLGLLLDTAQQGTHPKEFESVIKCLAPAASPMPLFKSARGNEKLEGIARSRASDLARKWGWWAQPIEFKEDALRPASWVMARHPELRTRADFRGDLRASVMAALRHDSGAGDSETRLAQLAGGSRSQVRNAIDNLQLTGRIAIRRAVGANRREIALAEAA